MKPRFRKRKSLAQGHPAGHGKYCQTLGHPGQDAREATKRPHRVGGVRAGRPVCELSCATGLNSPEPPRSRNLRAPRPSPNGRAFYSEPPGQLLGSVPARAQPQARVLSQSRLGTQGGGCCCCPCLEMGPRGSERPGALAQVTTECRSWGRDLLLDVRFGLLTPAGISQACPDPRASVPAA